MRRTRMVLVCCGLLAVMVGEPPSTVRDPALIVSREKVRRTCKRTQYASGFFQILAEVSGHHEICSHCQGQAVVLPLLWVRSLRLLLHSPEAEKEEEQCVAGTRCQMDV